MTITFFEATPEDESIITNLVSAQEGLKGAEIIFVPEVLSPSNIAKAKDAEVLGVFIHSAVTKEVIEQLPKLKLIVTLSTGFDHIDTAYAKTKNIAVANVPAYGSRTVAEFTFALMLGLSRKTFAAYRQVKDTHNFTIEPFEGFNLQGKTLGIIGTGRIGQNVAQIAQGFGMHLLAFDAFPNEEAAKKFNFAYVPLNTLLNQSDVITLHVPYNKDTHYLLNLKNISQCKRGAFLINTSRGEVIETQALVEALDNGTLEGVGIDVIEGEKQLIDEWHLAVKSSETAEHLKTLLQDHVLIDHPKVAYTPHIAFFSKEAKHEILNTTVENIVGFVGGTLRNQIKG